MVEFTLVVVFVFLPLLLIGVDFGRVFFSYIQVSNAAREAAAYGAANPTDTVGMESAALQETNTQSQRGEGAITLTTTCEDAAGDGISCSDASGGAGRGNTLTVTVAEDFSFFTPLINGAFNNNFSVGVSASTVVLGSAADPGGGAGPGPCDPPTLATFQESVPDLDQPLAVYFDPSDSQPDAGVCAISGYNWDFGDGTTGVGSAVGNPHEFPLAGSYAVILEVTNQGGSLSVSKVITVGTTDPPDPVVCEKPEASFTYTKDKKVYDFVDLSTVNDAVNCPITSWLWDFGDGDTLELSNSLNPTHTYKSADSHTVTLTVENIAGSSTFSSTQ